MIINCENCNKKFNINNNLIGENGRLLQCSACNYKWFYKPLKILDDEVEIDKDDKTNEINNLSSINQEKLSKNKIEHKIKGKLVKKNNKLQKNYFTLNNFIIIIISFISLIIVIDTFKSNLSIILPGLPIMLNNLYETLNDILLFLKDLIR